nr:dihydroxy-acid dehydratase [Salinispora arenicola]
MCLRPSAAPPPPAAPTRSTRLERAACPGIGACAGHYTANTMAVVLEFLGLSPFGSMDPPAVDARKDTVCRQAGELVMRAVAEGLRPSRFLTPYSLRNAIGAGVATGGSTNMVLHLLAIAREAGIPLDIDEFDRISSVTPIIADLRPNGKFTAVDLDRAGGTRVIARHLVDAGLIAGDERTVTGAPSRRRPRTRARHPASGSSPRWRHPYRLPVPS